MTANWAQVYHIRHSCFNENNKKQACIANQAFCFSKTHSNIQTKDVHLSLGGILNNDNNDMNKVAILQLTLTLLKNEN